MQRSATGLKSVKEQFDLTLNLIFPEVSSQLMYQVCIRNQPFSDLIDRLGKIRGAIKT